MGWISAIFVHKAIDAATQLGCLVPEERERLFRSVGVDPEAPADPSVMISESNFFGLLEAIAGKGGQGRTVPIRIGASMGCDDYGAFGLAFKSAPDLIGSFNRVERFGKVVTSVANFRVKCSGGSVFMEVIPGRDQRLGLTMTNELAVAAAMSLSREVSLEKVVPVAVHFMGHKHCDDSEYRTHFQCPIRYGADCDALELTLEAASRPNRLSDGGMSKFFEAHLVSELDQMVDTDVLENRVLGEIGEALSEGVPTVAEVAGRLGMSSRTLQRRLSSSGLAYQDLVGEARKRLSEKLLKRTDYALVEIAFLTGFSEQSTFTRAFKRWHGQTPAAYRRGE